MPFEWLRLDILKIGQGRRLEPSTLLQWSILAIVGVLVLYPMVMIVYGGLWSSSPGQPGYFTLQNYLEGYSEPGTLSSLWTSLWLAGLGTILNGAIGVFFCWVVNRTDTPGRRWLEVGFWLYFFMPFMPMAFAWVLLLGPDFGLINQALMKLPFIDHSIFNVYSYGGIIWARVHVGVSFMVLLLGPALRRVEASLEESARMSGASVLTTLRQITVPLLLPAVSGLMFLNFIKGLEMFETPLILGFPAGIYVYCTKIYSLLSASPRFGPAMSMTHVFMVILFFLIILQRKLIAGKQYTTITGRGFTVRPLALGRFRYVALGICLTWLFVGTALPVLTLLMGSFMSAFGFFLPEPFTTDHWVLTFKDALFWAALKNTLLMGVTVATIGMLLYSIVSYIGVKTQFRGRGALDFLSWLPWAVPSMVLALGILWAYVGGVRLPFTIYGTLWIMVLALIVKDFPVGVRNMNAGMMQLGKELEESSRVHGASFLRTFTRIVAPLLAPTFVATWVYVFLSSVRDLATVILLYSAKYKVLSVMTLEYWNSAGPERGLVLGLVMTIIALIGAIGMRALGGRQEIRS